MNVDHYFGLFNLQDEDKRKSKEGVITWLGMDFKILQHNSNVIGSFLLAIVLTFFVLFIWQLMQAKHIRILQH